MFKHINEALIWLESKPNIISFEKFSSLYQMLDINPVVPVIHVAGTNGKGSTVDYLRSVLEKSGYKVGTFVSPYLYKHHDRIRVNNHPIEDERLLMLINKWYDYSNKHQLSMFQTDFLMMLEYFKQEQVEVMVIETGIGGRFDCTNVVTPVLSIITTIGRDHQAMLGETIEAIASQKAGIIKPNVPVVVGKLGPTSLSVINQQAQAMSSRVIQPGPIKAVKPGLFHYKQFMDIAIQSDAMFQMENAIVAIEASLYLMKVLPNIKPYLIQMGVEQTFFEGRFEQIEEALWLDGAHNLDGIQRLLYELKSMQKEPIEVVFAGLQRPDLDQILAYIHDTVDHLILTTFKDNRIYDIEAYRGIYDIVEDYETLLVSPNNGIRVLTGSLHFVSVIKQTIKARKA